MALINNGLKLVTLGIPLNSKGTTYNLRGIIEHDTEDQQVCLTLSMGTAVLPKFLMAQHPLS